MVEVEVVGEGGWSFNLGLINADNLLNSPKVVFELVGKGTVVVDIEGEVRVTFEVKVAIEFEIVVAFEVCCSFNFDAIADTL